MNKKAVFLVLALFGFLGASFAQTSIGDVKLRFCNDVQTLSGGTTSGEVTKSLFLELTGGTQDEICMQFINESSQDTAVRVNFVDGTVTNDASQNKACKNETDVANFGQYVNIENDVIQIPAKSAQEATASVQFPKGKGGMINGCVTLHLDQQADQSGEMFKVMTRRGYFVDVLLEGIFEAGLHFDALSGSSLSSNPDILAYMDENNTLNIKFALENTGTIAQNLVITGTISSFLGYKQDFITTERKLVADESITLAAMVEDLPVYMGPFGIDIQVSYQPDISNIKDVPENISKPGVLSTSTTIFVQLRRMIAVVALIILVLLIVFKKKKSHKKTKKHHKKHK